VGIVIVSYCVGRREKGSEGVREGARNARRPSCFLILCLTCYLFLCFLLYSSYDKEIYIVITRSLCYIQSFSYLSLALATCEIALAANLLDCKFEKLVQFITLCTYCNLISFTLCSFFNIFLLCELVPHKRRLLSFHNPSQNVRASTSYYL
jgi:hypothetical protein